MVQVNKNESSVFSFFVAYAKYEVHLCWFFMLDESNTVSSAAKEQKQGRFGLLHKSKCNYALLHSMHTYICMALQCVRGAVHTLRQHKVWVINLTDLWIALTKITNQAVVIVSWIIDYFDFLVT